MLLQLLSLVTPKSSMLFIAGFLAVSASVYAISSERAKSNLRQEVSKLELSNKILEDNNKQLSEAIAKQKETISFLQNQAKLIQQEFENTQLAFAATRRDAEELKEQLQAVEVDRLSIESPSAAEISINDTTLKFDRCFELLSGAPLNETEQAATTAQEFNPMCPWVFDSIKP